MRTQTVLFLAVVSVVGCGYQSPAAPTTAPPPVTGPTSSSTISGRLTAVNGGLPIGGVAATIGQSSAITDGNGDFRVTVTQPAAVIRAVFTGQAIVPREIVFAVDGAASNLSVSAIQTNSGFDLAFYRELVRNGYVTPADLQPLRRWTRNPNIYIRTADDTGAPMDTRLLDLAERAFIETVPVWTAGHFSVASVVRGLDTHVGQQGWITVTWPSAPDPFACAGVTRVGAEGAEVQIRYRTGGGCSCAGLPVSLRTVRHEVGHAMGFWHTDSADDLMAGFGVYKCDAQPSARELYHAAIAYSRPVGNTDPDSDPVGTVSLAPSRVVQ